MLDAPIPENDEERLAAMGEAMCAFVPREERFDRITRTVRRLLDVPIALVSIVERDVQWFRSAQGLDAVETPRNISFCGHAVASGKQLVVNDATLDPRFWDNPLVTGAPYIRAYLGVPLTVAPGIRAGTLCALDNQVRTFSQQDILGMQDLAAMVESELKLESMGSAQRRLLATVGQLERKSNLDAATGCWNAKGFRELLAMTVADCRNPQRTEGDRGCSTLALCYVRVRNFGAVAAQDRTQVDIVRQLVAQLLRRRLPEGGALGALGERDFCALVPGPTQLAIEESLAEFTYPKLTLDMPGIHMDAELDLSFSLAFLDDAKGPSPATELWAKALAGLKA